MESLARHGDHDAPDALQAVARLRDKGLECEFVTLDDVSKFGAVDAEGVVVDDLVRAVVDFVTVEVGRSEGLGSSEEMGADPAIQPRMGEPGLSAAEQLGSVRI